jgi:hypothetical protein
LKPDCTFTSYVGAFATLAFIGHKAREIKFDRAMSRELIKVKEYKEKMYFEAVQEILDKLADPKMKGSAKANYQRQLKDLDPEGKIVKYLTGEAEKPDLTSFIEKNRFIYLPKYCIFQNI